MQEGFCAYKHSCQHSILCGTTSCLSCLPNQISRFPARPSLRARRARAHGEGARLPSAPPSARWRCQPRRRRRRAPAASNPARPGRRRPPWGPRVSLRLAEGVGSRLPEAAAAARSPAGVGPRGGNALQLEAVT